jgi:hypothetical protein
MLFDHPVQVDVDAVRAWVGVVVTQARVNDFLPADSQQSNGEVSETGG